MVVPAEFTAQVGRARSRSTIPEPSELYPTTHGGESLRTVIGWRVRVPGPYSTVGRWAHPVRTSRPPGTLSGRFSVSTRQASISISPRGPDQIGSSVTLVGATDGPAAAIRRDQTNRHHASSERRPRASHRDDVSGSAASVRCTDLPGRTTSFLESPVARRATNAEFRPARPAAARPTRR